MAQKRRQARARLLLPTSTDQDDGLVALAVRLEVHRGFHRRRGIHDACADGVFALGPDHRLLGGAFQQVEHLPGLEQRQALELSATPSQDSGSIEEVIKKLPGAEKFREYIPDSDHLPSIFGNIGLRNYSMIVTREPQVTFVGLSISTSKSLL